jgi:hypothetical protein
LEKIKRTAEGLSQTQSPSSGSGCAERIKERYSDAPLDSLQYFVLIFNAFSLHMLWIRFLKVKEELRVMKEERTKKENAYRLMQRESKQCDVIQKELTKLKESKVAPIFVFCDLPSTVYFACF